MVDNKYKLYFRKKLIGVFDSYERAVEYQKNKFGSVLVYYAQKTV